MGKPRSSRLSYSLVANFPPVSIVKDVIPESNRYHKDSRKTTSNIMGCGNSKDVNEDGKKKQNASGRTGQQSKQGRGNQNKGENGRNSNQVPRNENLNEKGYKNATPRENGYRKRIRENLRKATAGSDVEELEHAIKAFEKNKLEDNGDLTDAKERLCYLHLRRDLRDAIMRRHPGVLDKTIYRVENSNYRSDLAHPLENAKRLWEHLTVLDNYRHDILEMEQSTISELRSYHHPPVGVHEVMTCTYSLLGYEEEQLRDWTDVQCLLGRYGKDSLVREIRKADTINIDDQTSQRVLNMQSKFTLEHIRAVSNGAATFYIWNQNMCNKSNKDRQQEQQQRQTPSKNSTQPQNVKGRKKNKG